MVSHGGPDFRKGTDRSRCGFRSVLNQIRTVDKKRLVQQLGKLSKTKLEEVNRALRTSLGLVTL